MVEERSVVEDAFSLLMWGERGLVTTLFVDISAAGREGWAALFQGCQFAPPPFDASRLVGARVVVEPDFGAFGKPDAVIWLRLDDGTARVVLVEAKRGLWGPASAVSTQRGTAGFNSRLNGQLELNHTLAVALAGYQEGAPELVDPEWVLHTPYSSTRRGSRFALKNPAALRDVVAPLSGLPFEHYLHLVITSDVASPAGRDDLRAVMPELYHPDYPFRNAWTDLGGRFGWTNWDRLSRAVGGLNDAGRLGHASYFLPTLEVNRRNMGGAAADPGLDTAAGADGEAEAELDVPGPAAPFPASPAPDVIGFLGDLDLTGAFRPSAIGTGTVHRGPLPFRSTKGVSLVYAPRYNRNTFLHFSWEGESCRLRDYSGRAQRPPMDPGRRSAVERHIEREVQVPRRGHSVGDVDYWYQQVQHFNRQHLRRGA
jgi:hypothetical protein